LKVHGKRAIGFYLGMLLMCAPAVAQETLSLEDAIARALAYSARLTELEARQAGAAATELARRAAQLPIVTAQGGYLRTNHVDPYVLAQPGRPLQILYPDVPDNFRTRLDLQWPIYNGGRAEALEHAARAEKDAIAGDVSAARADLRLEVTRAFWALVTARETEQVVSRAVDRLDAHVRDLRASLEQGLVLPSDVTASEAQRSRQQLLAIEARNTRLVSEADLRRLTGASGPLVPRLPAGRAEVTGGPGPERKALEKRVDAARAREQAARAGGLPQVTASGGFDYASPNPRIFPRSSRWDDSWDLSLNVSWTLWDSGRRKAEEAEAAAATRGLETRITEFDRQTRFEVEQRDLELESARAAITTAEEGIRSATETQRVLRERYRAGVATNTEVLDAEVALLQAELDRTRALASARLAEARLERARVR
jgi:outer membrane protein